MRGGWGGTGGRASRGVGRRGLHHWIAVRRAGKAERGGLLYSDGIHYTKTHAYIHTLIHICIYIHTCFTLIGNPITTGTAREGERLGIEPPTNHTAVHGVDRSAIQPAVWVGGRRYKAWRGREGRTTCRVILGSRFPVLVSPTPLPARGNAVAGTCRANRAVMVWPTGLFGSVPRAPCKVSGATIGCTTCDDGGLWLQSAAPFHCWNLRLLVRQWCKTEPRISMGVAYWPLFVALELPICRITHFPDSCPPTLCMQPRPY